MLLMRSKIMVGKLNCKLLQDNQYMTRKNLQTLRLYLLKLNQLLKTKSQFTRAILKNQRKMQQHLHKRANHPK
jgi:hypothetical protein